MAKAFIENYFDYFDLQVAFDLDVDELNDRYMELQATSHPDYVRATSADDKKEAQGNAILINEAYQTLKSPLKRAEYLLSLVFKKCDFIKPAQEFLLEVLDMREQAKKDDLFLNTAYHSCIQKIQDAFSSDDMLSMAHHTLRLKYITKIKEDICN